MSSPRDAVTETCIALPRAELTYPFGDQTAVFKVGGKVFAFFSQTAEPVMVTLKCDPERAAALVREYEQIVPGYHVNKRHWISVTLDPAPPDRLVHDLIEDSYDLVVAGLPVRARPPSRRW